MELSLEQRIHTMDILVPDFERVVRDGTVTWLDTRDQPAEEALVAVYIDTELSRAKRKRKDYIESVREEYLAKDVPYSFPDGDNDAIQVREKDKIALLTVNASALNLINLGVTDPVMTFRSASDRRHFLTPQQAYDMTNYVTEFMSSIYGQSWDLKDQIDRIIHVEGDDLQVALEAIEAIDWPPGDA